MRARDAHGALLLAVLTVSVRGAPETTIAVDEPWHAVFGGRETVFHAVIHGEDGVSGRVRWELRVSRRTILRSEREFRVADAGSATVEVRLPLPPVKPGVIVPASVEISAALPGAEEPGATVTRRLWVFHEDAFAHRAEWLEQLRIRLFDPEGSTEKVLDAARVPYDYVRQPSVLETEETAAVLVLGAGLSLEDYPQLGRCLVRLAAQGHRVLCLRPRSGEMPLPGTADSELPTPARLEFRRRQVIRELDKRLDHVGWPPDGKLAGNGLAMSVESGLIAGRVTAASDGWPWVATHFPGGGRLVVCGFPIIEKWEAGPTPRFLFARILEWLTREENQAKEDEP